MSYKVTKDKKKYDAAVKKLFGNLTQEIVGAYFKGGSANMNNIPFHTILAVGNKRMALKFGNFLQRIILEREGKGNHEGPILNLAEIYLFGDGHTGELYINSIKSKRGKDAIESPGYFRMRREKLNSRIKQLEKDSIEKLGLI